MMSGSLLARMLGAGPSVTFDALRKASETGSAHVIDLREPEEFATGHIRGARNMPMSAFNPATLPTGKPVILICQSGKCAADARRACEGADGVSHYGPGIVGWCNHGGPLVRG